MLRNDIVMAMHNLKAIPPKLSLFKWLLAPLQPVSVVQHQALLGHLLLLRPIFVIGDLAYVIIAVAAVVRQPGLIFSAMLVTSLAVFLLRIGVLISNSEAYRAGRSISLTLSLLTVLIYPSVLGLLTFFCFVSQDSVLQVLSATTTVAFAGALCAGNPTFPRLAMAQVLLCDIPLKIGAAATGDPWLLIFVLQSPLYLGALWIALGTMHANLIAALKSEYEHAKRADTDALTGLINRAGLKSLAAALEADMTHRLPLGVLYIDLDGFKDVNDTFGHEAGDSVLRQAADRFRNLVREEDKVVRLGGDEFLIVLVNCMPDTVLNIGYRIVSEMSSPIYINKTHETHISASVGIALGKTGVPDSLTSLMMRADKAMYKSKRDGKGCVTLAT